MSGQYDVDANGRRMFVPHVANLERTVIFESLESRKATLENRAAELGSSRSCDYFVTSIYKKHNKNFIIIFYLCFYGLK